MSETVSGLARVAALLLVTTLFAVIWKGDQQTQQQFVVARKAAAEQNRKMLLAKTSFMTTQPSATHRDIALAPLPKTVPVSNVAALTQVPATTRVEIEMELPAGISNGRYRVIDQSGATWTIRIKTGQQRADHQDIYVLDGSEGSRRFFIRISDISAGPSPGPFAAGQPPLQR